MSFSSPINTNTLALHSPLPTQWSGTGTLLYSSSTNINSQNRTHNTHQSHVVTGYFYITLLPKGCLSWKIKLVQTNRTKVNSTFISGLWSAQHYRKVKTYGYIGTWACYVVLCLCKLGMCTGLVSTRTYDLVQQFTVTKKYKASQKKGNTVLYWSPPVWAASQKV